MSGVFLYETKGYKAGVGWSAASSDLLVSNGTSYVSLDTLKSSAFYRTASGWRRFYASLNIEADSVNDISIPSPASLQAGFTLNANGSSNGFSTTVGWLGFADWDTTKHIDGEMEALVTIVSNTTPVTGTIGSWQALTSNRQWSIAGNLNDESQEAVLSVTIRHAPSAVNVISKNVTLLLAAGTG